MPTPPRPPNGSPAAQGDPVSQLATLLIQQAAIHLLTIAERFGMQLSTEGVKFRGETHEVVIRAKLIVGASANEVPSPLVTS